MKNYEIKTFISFILTLVILITSYIVLLFSPIFAFESNTNGIEGTVECSYLDILLGDTKGKIEVDYNDSNTYTEDSFKDDFFNLITFKENQVNVNGGRTISDSELYNLVENGAPKAKETKTALILTVEFFVQLTVMIVVIVTTTRYRSLTRGEQYVHRYYHVVRAVGAIPVIRMFMFLFTMFGARYINYEKSNDYVFSFDYLRLILVVLAIALARSVVKNVFLSTEKKIAIKGNAFTGRPLIISMFTGGRAYVEPKDKAQEKEQPKAKPQPVQQRPQPVQQRPQPVQQRPQSVQQRPQPVNQAPISYKGVPEQEKIEILKRYKDLLDSGLITQAEFEKKKSELLS